MGLDPGETYRNDKSCKDFICAISEVEEMQIRDDMAKHKFITVISDGSTDVSAIENEIVYCRSAHLGIARIVFCSLEAIGKADAEGIYVACTTSLTKTIRVDSLGKVVAFAAAVNAGSTMV